ncbi:hypothetical protein KP509_10G034600 [Ceratopteris richardii]|uniref:Uncharacterized protein n=1 Tax=Ceratopteris richardii TaxID=49495 RepID=A0A8T2U3Q2_CERRI|nr:hypothetical protein KP509_10G034600 [Ceratopteris richardii]
MMESTNPRYRNLHRGGDGRATSLKGRPTYHFLPGKSRPNAVRIGEEGQHSAFGKRTDALRRRVLGSEGKGGLVVQWTEKVSLLTEGDRD